MFTLQGNFQLNFEVIGISYLCPSWCPLIIAIHETKFEIEEENTKLKMVMKLPLRPLLFSAFKWSAGQFSQIVKTFEDSTEKIEENQRQSQFITGERLLSWSLGLITIIILVIFTTANNSPNPAHWRFLVTLERGTINIFFKNITLARAPTLGKNPLEPP